MTWFESATQSAWQTFGYTPWFAGPRETVEAVCWLFILGVVIAAAVLVWVLVARVRRTTRSRR
jgi:hypothetical protein